MDNDGFDLDAGGGVDLDRLFGNTDEGGGDEGLTDEQKAEKARREQYDTSLAEARAANTALTKKLDGVLSQVEALQARKSFDTSLDGRGAPLPPFDPAKFKADMARLAVEDPGEFAIRLIAATEQLANAKIAASAGPLGATTTGLEIQNYTNARAVADEDFREAQQEFNELITQPGALEGLAGAAPELRKKTLDLLADAAIGRASKRIQNGATRQRQAPDYSGGMGIALATQTPVTMGGKPLNAVQREILRSAQEAGITDKKRLKSMLDDAAGDN